MSDLVNKPVTVAAIAYLCITNSNLFFVAESNLCV